MMQVERASTGVQGPGNPASPLSRQKLQGMQGDPPPGSEADRGGGGAGAPDLPPLPHNVILVFRKLELSLMLSVCVLYSMMVLGGRLSTRRNVSRMRAVVAWSLAVLFHMEMMSS